MVARPELRAAAARAQSDRCPLRRGRPRRGGRSAVRTARHCRHKSIKHIARIATHKARPARAPACHQGRAAHATRAACVGEAARTSSGSTPSSGSLEEAPLAGAVTAATCATQLPTVWLSACSWMGAITGGGERRRERKVEGSEIAYSACRSSTSSYDRHWKSSGIVAFECSMRRRACHVLACCALLCALQGAGVHAANSTSTQVPVSEVPIPPPAASSEVKAPRARVFPGGDYQSLLTWAIGAWVVRKASTVFAKPQWNL